jgi:hypothetical protein
MDATFHKNECVGVVLAKERARRQAKGSARESKY